VPLVHKSFQYRIYPTDDQKKFLDQQFGGARFVYNFFLNRRKDEYLNNKKSLSYFDDAKFLTDLKEQDGYAWMNDIVAQSLQASLRNLEVAFSNFFKKKAKFPNFHSKKNEECIKFPQNFDVKNEMLRVPKLKSKIKINFHQLLPEKQIALFIRKTPSGKYFASFLCEVNIDPLPISPNSVGIDLGIKSLIIESNGNTVENPKFLKHLEPRLIFKQKQLSKKQKGSNKRNKARIIFAKQHEKIANKRKDLLHKLSRRLINENQVIIAENLAVKNMMKNHKLAKAISDVSWGELLRQIEYKAKWYGRTFYQIDRFFPSSKTCNNCQFVVDKLPLNIRSWICPKCKTKLDRDLNAAKNIRDKGLSDLKNLSSKEELSVCGTQTDVKQKPEEAFSSVSKKKLKKQEKSKRREIQSES
jgi:putative transposase